MKSATMDDAVVRAVEHYLERTRHILDTLKLQKQPDETLAYAGLRQDGGRSIKQTSTACTGTECNER